MLAGHVFADGERVDFCISYVFGCCVGSDLRAG